MKHLLSRDAPRKANVFYFMAIQKVKRFSGSMYRGVSRYNSYGKQNLKKQWVAYVFDKKRKRIHLGYFQTQNDAAIKVNEASVLIYGKDAILNTIVDTPQTTSKNPLWLTSKFGKYWKELSKKEIIEKISKEKNPRFLEDNINIIKWLDGDTDAFGLITNKYYKYWIKAVKYEVTKHGKKSYRKNGTRETEMQYCDFVSEGIMQAMKSIKRGRYNGINIKGFVDTICRHKYYDFNRKKYNIPSWYTLNKAKNPRTIKEKYLTR